MFTFTSLDNRLFLHLSSNHEIPLLKFLVLLDKCLVVKKCFHCIHKEKDINPLE